MSAGEPLAVYNGREWLGSILVRDDAFVAKLPNGRVLGTYASQAEVCDARAAAHGRQHTGAAS